MVPAGAAGCDTAFTVTIDHRDAGSGIGAHDRALTIRKRPRPATRGPSTSCGPATCSRCARARAACSSGAATPRRPSTWRASPGCAPVAVICEVLHDDGSPARFPYLELFAEEHRIAMVSVAQLVEYREQAGTAGARRTLLLYARLRCSDASMLLLGGADGAAVDDLVEVLREAVAGAARCTTTRSCPRRCASRAARPRASCGGCAAG